MAPTEKETDTENESNAVDDGHLEDETVIEDEVDANETTEDASETEDGDEEDGEEEDGDDEDGDDEDGDEEGGEEDDGEDDDGDDDDGDDDDGDEEDGDDDDGDEEDGEEDGDEEDGEDEDGDEDDGDEEDGEEDGDEEDGEDEDGDEDDTEGADGEDEEGNETSAPQSEATTSEEDDEDGPDEFDEADEENAAASMGRDESIQALYALLFASDRPMSPTRLAEALSDEMDPEIVSMLLAELQEDLNKQDALPYFLKEIGGGYQLMTKATYAPFIRRLYQIKKSKRLSKAVLETLAIIAYKQPTTRAEVEAIRGVSVSHAFEQLQERRFIKVSGVADLPGRPKLFRTTEDFLLQFGLGSLKELPTLEELQETR